MFEIQEKETTEDQENYKLDPRTPILEVSIYEILERSKFPDYEEDLNYISYPIISKSIWTALGDKLSSNEKLTTKNILPEDYFTIRLDGKNFSTLIPKLKKLGIFSEGYSKEFETIMQKISYYITTIFQGVLFVFTQSDEITVLINKIKNLGTIYNVPKYGGRLNKILSLSAGLVSSKFLFLIMEIAISKGLDISLLSSLNIAFDSRIGRYDTLEDAFELILWRSYDCSVNGISDAIYKSKIPNKKEAFRFNSTKKLYVLKENNLLPLFNHQAYGTLLVRRKVEYEKINNKTGVFENIMKSVNEETDGPVITNLKNKVIVLDDFL